MVDENFAHLLRRHSQKMSAALPIHRRRLPVRPRPRRAEHLEEHFIHHRRWLQGVVGTLGGLYLFGPIGFIVGPIVCGLFLTVLDIYGATFKDILPPVRSLSTGETKTPKSVLDEK